MTEEQIELRRAVLPAILKAQRRRLLRTEDVALVELWLSRWLLQAELAPPPRPMHKGGLFGRMASVHALREPDGSPGREMFTCLNQASRVADGRVQWCGPVAWGAGGTVCRLSLLAACQRAEMCAQPRGSVACGPRPGARAASRPVLRARYVSIGRVYPSIICPSVCPPGPSR